MKKKYLVRAIQLTLVLALACSNTIAQYPISAPGKNGIFILFDHKIPHDFNYKLERKITGEKTNWETLHTTSIKPFSYFEVEEKIRSLGIKMPFSPSPDSLSIVQFMKISDGKTTTDSIYYFNAFPLYLETLGTAFFDNTIIPGILYEYRVSKTDKSGKSFSSSVTKPASFPEKRKDILLNLSESKPLGNSIVLRYKFAGTDKALGVKVLRNNHLQTIFREIKPSVSFVSSKEGIQVLISDPMVEPQMIYNYIVVPQDFLGNEGIPSDTFMIINNSPFDVMPALLTFDAEALENENGIKLRWKISSTQNLRGISLFRSTNFEGNYPFYTKLLPTDTIFIDRNIEPITNYYYYLVLHGFYNDSPESAKVIGLSKYLKRPLIPPQQVTVSQTSAGNKVRWKATGSDTKGYYLFRGEGYGGQPEQISELITSDSSYIEYTDPRTNLRAGEPYFYAVKLVNQSNMESTLSDKAHALEMKPDLPTPLNLYIRPLDGKALLIWEDMTSISNYVTGYEVWRKTENEKAEMITNPGSISTNRFIDTTLVRGIKYEYFVQATGNAESKSSLGEGFEFILSKVKPVPPSGFRATKTDQGVVINWDIPAVEGLTGFKLYSENLTGNRILVATLNANEWGYTDLNKTPGTYFYTITSVTGKEESEPSDEIGIKIEN